MSPLAINFVVGGACLIVGALFGDWCNRDWRLLALKLGSIGSLTP